VCVRACVCVCGAPRHQALNCFISNGEIIIIIIIIII
jgi:hypothetical protein